MSLKPFGIYVALAILVIGMSESAIAGLEYTYTMSQNDASGSKQNCLFKSYYEPEKLRSEVGCEAALGNGKTVSTSVISIFRADKGLMLIIHPEINQYSEMTESEKKTIEAQTPPMYKQAKFVYKKTGKTWKVKKWTCEVYEHFREGQKIDDTCVIDGKQILPGLQEASTLGEQEKTFEVIGAGLEADAEARKKAMGGVRFILKVVGGDQSEQMVMEFGEAHARSIPDSLFELPPGAKKIQKRQ